MIKLASIYTVWKKLINPFQLNFYVIDPTKDWYWPSRSHKSDSGVDLKTPFAFELTPGSMQKIPLNLGVELPYLGFLRKWLTLDMFLQPKSGLGLRGVFTTGGVIDNGYRGELMANLMNLGQETIKFEAGDKVCQGVVRLVFIPEVAMVGQPSNNNTDRGTKGFGSTGR